MMYVATKEEIDDSRKVLMFNTDEDLIIMWFDNEIKNTFHRIHFDELDIRIFYQ